MPVKVMAPVSAVRSIAPVTPLNAPPPISFTVMVAPSMFRLATAAVAPMSPVKVTAPVPASAVSAFTSSTVLLNRMFPVVAAPVFTVRFPQTCGGAHGSRECHVSACGLNIDRGGHVVECTAELDIAGTGYGKGPQ